MNKRTLTIGLLLLLLVAGAALLQLRSRSLTGEILVLGSSDLVISLSGPATVSPSGTAKYTVTVTNNGPDTRYSFTFRIFNQNGQTLSLNGFSYVPLSPGCGLYSGGILECDYPEAMLSVNQSAIYDVSFISSSICDTNFSIGAYVWSSTPQSTDPDLSNNGSSMVSTTVACSAEEHVQNLADTNHDGIVSVHEMRVVIPAVIRAVETQIVVSGVALPPPDLRYDINGDGTLTLEDMTEAVRILRNMLILQYPRI